MTPSWIASANDYRLGFGIDNLPLCRFDGGHAGTVIGEFVLDLKAVGGYDRDRLTELLRHDAVERPPEKALHPLRNVIFDLPDALRSYTDFYASKHHAERVGARFRPEQPLLPNYTHLPVAYHGRASSIVVSGAAIRRPHGQLGPGQFGPTQELDYEMELGLVMAAGNLHGVPIPVDKAADRFLGFCLVNDWSARDIQRWEYQPLGPFLGKSFATTVSPLLVVPEALEPFRVPVPDREDLAEYLRPAGFLYDIWIEARVNGTVRGRANTRELFWTFEQMVAHHTVNGCNLMPGDLLASGTVSGPSADECGCLLESGSGYLQDGDQVVIEAWAERGDTRIGFGECRGTVHS